MSSDSGSPVVLTHEQQATLSALVATGSEGTFDQKAMADLFVMGLVEIRTADRRVVLTERGHHVLAAIQGIQPVYDVVVDSGDGKQVTIESGLSREMANAARAKAMELFQGVRIVERAPSPPSSIADGPSGSK